MVLLLEATLQNWVLSAEHLCIPAMHTSFNAVLELEQMGNKLGEKSLSGDAPLWWTLHQHNRKVSDHIF